MYPMSGAVLNPASRWREWVFRQPRPKHPHVSLLWYDGETLFIRVPKNNPQYHTSSFMRVRGATLQSPYVRYFAARVERETGICTYLIYRWLMAERKAVIERSAQLCSHSFRSGGCEVRKAAC